MEVLEPDSLREKVVNAAKSVISFYAERRETMDEHKLNKE
jgi:hypothetical protein